VLAFSQVVMGGGGGAISVENENNDEVENTHNKSLPYPLNLFI
jgi:hypothetical protein